MTDGRGRGSAPGVDDDLLFDLEYEQSDRRRSASADSCRFDGRVDQQDTSQVPVLRVRSFKLRQEEWYGSLPGHTVRNHRRHVCELDEGYRHPQDQFAFSVPSHPSHPLQTEQQLPWEDGVPGLASPELSSSVSSVEEATEFGPAGKTLRKTFNQLEVEVEDPQTLSATKSPRFLTKFLRASFSKLISKDKQRKESFICSTPVSRSPSIINCTDQGPQYSHQHHQQEEQEESSYHDDRCLLSPDYSPKTGEFIRECLDKGLPIIPFNYSTAEIVEKQRESQRRKVTEHVEVGRGDVSIIQASSPRDRYTDSEWREREEDKSLEGLLTLARREMEQEKQLRKISGVVSGYAANNSRALQRRRSSVSEYVLSQDEQEASPSSSASTNTNTSSGRRRRRKVRRHVLTQESYESVSPVGSEAYSSVGRTRRTSSLDKHSNLNSKLY